MPEKLTEEEIYRRAHKRVEDKKSFFVHLLVYVVVNAALSIIWLLTTSPGYPWFIWPLFGWGIGLVFHFLSVFFFDRDTSWEQAEVEKEAERLRRSQQ
jgi:hypothetical protein